MAGWIDPPDLDALLPAREEPAEPLDLATEEQDAAIDAGAWQTHPEWEGDPAGLVILGEYDDPMQGLKLHAPDHLREIAAELLARATAQNAAAGAALFRSENRSHRGAAEAYADAARLVESYRGRL